VIKKKTKAITATWMGVLIKMFQSIMLYISLSKYTATCLIFIISGLCYTHLSAKNNDPFLLKSTLKYTTHTEHKGFYQLGISKEGGVFINGRRLNSMETIRHNKNLIKLVQNTKLKKETFLQCSTGTYTYKIEKNKKNRIESGCMGSPRFYYLLTTFKNINKQRVYGQAKK